MVVSHIAILRRSGANVQSAAGAAAVVVMQPTVPQIAVGHENTAATAAGADRPVAGNFTGGDDGIRIGSENAAALIAGDIVEHPAIFQPAAAEPDTAAFVGGIIHRNTTVANQRLPGVVNPTAIGVATDVGRYPAGDRKTVDRATDILPDENDMVSIVGRRAGLIDKSVADHRPTVVVQHITAQDCFVAPAEAEIGPFADGMFRPGETAVQLHTVADHERDAAGIAVHHLPGRHIAAGSHPDLIAVPGRLQRRLQIGINIAAPQPGVAAVHFDIDRLSGAAEQVIVIVDLNRLSLDQAELIFQIPVAAVAGGVL